MPKKRDKTPMEKLTAGYEEFIKGKQVKKAGKSAFNKVIKKATRTKARGSK